MAELLSQKEIDELFTAVNNDDEELEDFQTVDTASIKPHDFKRPRRFTQDQLRAISSIGDPFAHSIAKLFANLTGKESQVSIASVYELLYREFIRSIPTPASLAVIHMKPLGDTLFEIGPSISKVLLGSYPPNKVSKAINILTGHESSELLIVFKRILLCLRKTWCKTINVYPKLGIINTAPHLFNIVSPTESCIVITLECRIGDYEDLLNFCIPYTTIKPVLSKFTSENIRSLITEGKDTEPSSLNDTLDSVNLPVSVELGRSELPLKNIRQWQEGSILKLNKLSTEPVDVYVGNVKVAEAEVVILEGENFGIRITKVIGKIAAGN
jgi:flagellar motor switch protein FliM